MEFKIGDRVRVNSTGKDCFIVRVEGCIGVIVGFNPSKEYTFPYTVDFSDNLREQFLEEELSHLTPLERIT